MSVDETPPLEVNDDSELVDMFVATLKRNVVRSRIMADLWSSELHEDMDDDTTPERFKEIYSMISFDILENILTIVPPEEGVIIATNIDHYLQIELLNKKYSIDIMGEFQREFVDKYGERLPTDSEFSELVADFETDWSSTPKDYLDGLTPNEALERTFNEWNERSDGQ